MIFVLVPLRWRSSSGPAATFRAADVFSYHYLPPEASMFLISEPFIPLEPVAELPPAPLDEAASTFVLPAEESEFLIPPETSIFGVGLE